MSCGAYCSTATMRQVLSCVFPLLLAIAAFALPFSGPYHDSNDQAAFRVQEASEDSFIQWELPPIPNSTHHLIFNSVSGLLQRWPNTFRRNGGLVEPFLIHRSNLRYADFNPRVLPTPRPQYGARHYTHWYYLVPWSCQQSCARCSRLACV